MRTISIIPQSGIAITTEHSKFVFERIAHFFKFCIKRIATSIAPQRKSMFVATTKYMVNNEKLPSFFAAAIAFASIFIYNIISHSSSIAFSIYSSISPIRISQYDMLEGLVIFFCYYVSTFFTNGRFTIKTVTLCAKAIPAFFYQTFCTFSHNTKICRINYISLYIQNIYQQTNEHNAIEDARWNKKLFEFLAKL